MPWTTFRPRDARRADARTGARADWPVLSACLVGVAVWVVVVLAPQVSLLAAVLDGSGGGEAPSGRIVALTVESVKLAAIVSVAAVVLGYVPGRLLAARSGAGARRAGWSLALVLAPLLIPQYLLYYAWGLLLSPTTHLGRLVGADMQVSRAVFGTISVLVLALWYWPLGAVVISQGWRNLDADLWNDARLDAAPAQRFARVTLPLLARSLATAFGVCFVLGLSEYGTFHLAGVRTIGTELSLLYDETHRASAVARAAWPLALPALAMGLILWKKTADWSVQTPLAPPQVGRSAWRWAILAALLAWSPLAPLALLAANMDSLSPFRDFLALHADELGWSLAISATAAAAALLMAGAALLAERFARPGRAISMLMHVTMFLAMFLPGSLIGVSLVKLQADLRLPVSLRESFLPTAAGQAARFAGLALLFLRFAHDSRDRGLSELASVDGASGLRAFWSVHLPRVWPVAVGAFLIVAMFGMTELPATMVLLPAGMPCFAQRLVNQMHYARQQEVIASCLTLVGSYAVLALAAIGVLRVVGRRAAAVVLCGALGLGLWGCEGKSAAPGNVKVLRSFGHTGRGGGEFVYPRAIDLAADGTVFVADKTGRIQHLSPAGEVIAVFQMPLSEAGKPTGISVSPDGNLYVADTHYHRVIVFAPDGRLLRELGRFGREGGCFIYPTDVAFLDGRVYVSEYGGNDRVSVFDGAGRFLFSFGSPGDGPGELSRPSALCVDRARRVIYVADACNHRVARYDPDGKLLGYIGSVGREAGQLRYPYGLALIGGAGGPGLVVCEFGNNRLQVFSPEGKPLAVYGAPGRELGQLAYPWGVAVGADRTAYVVDSGNDRVQVWRL